MFIVLINVLYGLIMATAGGLVVWLYWTYTARKAVCASQDDSRQAHTVLAQLQQWALRMATDVDEHSGRMGEISEELQAEGEITAEALVSRVGEIVQANQQMQQRLNEAEERLQEQAEIIESQATQVRTDPLTRVVNRLGFDEELDRRFCEFKRHGTPFSVVLLDLDQFKRFNDEYGHQSGDEVLRGVAGVLLRTMRGIDLVTRYGGEEFAIVLPHTSVQDALLAAERARQAIEQKRFRFEGNNLSVTASFGVAQLRPSEHSSLLIRRTDEALYAAKAAGRNNTHWHDGRTIRPIENSDNPETPPNELAEQDPQPSKARADQFPVRQADDLADSLTDAPEPTAVNTDLEADGVPAQSSLHTPHPQAEEQQPPENGEPAAPAGRVTSRTEFCRTVQQRLAEWKRGGAGFSVILLNIRNRRPGAVKGQHGTQEHRLDVFLRSVTAVIREMDLLAEYESETFSFLLPGVEQAEAVAVGRRLCHTVETCIPANGSKPTDILASAGLAEASSGDDMVRLLTRTEEALQAAMQHGDDGGFYYHNSQWAEPVAPRVQATMA